MADREKKKILLISSGRNVPELMQQLAGEYDTAFITLTKYKSLPENSFANDAILVYSNTIDIPFVNKIIDIFSKKSKKVILVTNSQPAAATLELACLNGFANILYPPLSLNRISILLDRLTDQNENTIIDHPDGRDINSLSEYLEKRTVILKREMEENINLKLDLKNKTDNLKRKLREMNTVLQLINISEKQEMSTGAFMKRALRILIAGFSHPEECYGYFRFRNISVSAGDTKEGNNVILLKRLFHNENVIGEIKVGFKNISSRSKLNIEDKNLVSVFARYIGNFLIRREGENRLILFKELVEQSPNAIIITDSEGKIEYSNPVTGSLFRYDPDSLTGKYFEFASQEDVDSGKYEQMLETLSSQDSWSGELRMRRGDDKIIWTHTVVSPVIKGGEVINYVAQISDIDASKRTENENRENLSRFQTLVGSMKDGVLIIDKNGKILFINSSAGKGLGINPDDAVGRYLFEILPESRRKNLQKYLKTLFIDKKGVDRQIDYELHGKIRYYDLSFRLLDTREGEPETAMVIAHEVTSYKEAQKLIEKSRKNFELLAENSPSGVVILSMENKVIFANKKTADIFGTTLEKYLSSSIFDYIKRENKDKLIHKISKRFSGKMNDNLFIQQVLTASGDIKYLQILAARTTWTGKKAILYNFLDITERIRTERWSDIELKIYKLSGKSLSLKRFSQKLIEFLSEVDWVDSGGVYLMDENKGRVELIYHEGLNEKFIESVRAFDTDSVQYKMLEKGEIIYDFKERVNGENSLVINREALQAMVIIPLIFRGKVVGSLNLASHEFDDVPDIDKSMLTNIGLTVSQTLALKKIQQRLVNLNKELKNNLRELQQKQQMLIQKSKLESLGELAAGIAHEINQPLGIISLAMENIQQSLMSGMADPEYLEKKFAAVYDRIEKARQILEHIRIFSREQDTVLLERVNVNHVINNALGLVEQQFKNHHIEIVKELDKDISYTLGNPYKLEQVFLNLLSNSKYALGLKAKDLDNKDYKMRIHLKTFNENDYVNIQFTDNGKGIDPEDIGRIFTPFFTTKPTDDGTGLGLSIVYGIVKEINGNIKVTSEPGKTTTFHISLRKYDTLEPVK